MRPYYEDDFVTLYHGDAVALLNEQHLQEHGPFDFLVTDPPYEVGKAGWDKYPKGSLEAAWALVEKAAMVFWSAFDLNGPAATFSDGCLKNTIIWHKPNLPALWMWDRGRLASQWEPIFYHARKGFEPALRPTDVWSINYPANGAMRLHPTQKPLGLMERVLKTLSSGTAREIVLDPFAGSGTTLVAAKNTGRRAVGIEQSEKFCEITAERLNQGLLFGDVA